MERRDNMRQLLMGPMLDYVRRIEEDSHAVSVVEDGAPVHTAKPVKVVRNLGSFPTQFHPPASPDLNTIEDMWAILKHHLHRLPRHPTSVDKLWETVQRLWVEMDQDIIDNTIKDMLRRREEPRKAKDGAVRAPIDQSKMPRRSTEFEVIDIG